MRIKMRNELTLLPNSIKLDRFCNDLAIRIKLLDAFSLGMSRYI